MVILVRIRGSIYFRYYIMHTHVHTHTRTRTREHTLNLYCGTRARRLCHHGHGRWLRSHQLTSDQVLKVSPTGQNHLLTILQHVLKFLKTLEMLKPARKAAREKMNSSIHQCTREIQTTIDTPTHTHAYVHTHTHTYTHTHTHTHTHTNTLTCIHMHTHTHAHAHAHAHANSFSFM
jgi:hypothetical protein